MAHARLHMICGNCGCNDMFEFEIVTDYDDNKECDYQRVSISCGNCATLHCLEDNAKEKTNKEE